MMSIMKALLLLSMTIQIFSTQIEDHLRVAFKDLGFNDTVASKWKPKGLYTRSGIVYVINSENKVLQLRLESSSKNFRLRALAVPSTASNLSIRGLDLQGETLLYGSDSKTSHFVSVNRANGDVHKLSPVNGLNAPLKTFKSVDKPVTESQFYGLPRGSYKILSAQVIDGKEYVFTLDGDASSSKVSLWSRSAGSALKVSKISSYPGSLETSIPDHFSEIWDPNDPNNPKKVIAFFGPFYAILEKSELLMKLNKLERHRFLPSALAVGSTPTLCLEVEPDALFRLDDKIKFLRGNFLFDFNKDMIYEGMMTRLNIDPVDSVMDDSKNHRLLVFRAKEEVVEFKPKKKLVEGEGKQLKTHDVFKFMDISKTPKRVIAAFHVHSRLYVFERPQGVQAFIYKTGTTEWPVDSVVVKPSSVLKIKEIADDIMSAVYVSPDQNYIYDFYLNKYRKIDTKTGKVVKEDSTFRLMADKCKSFYSGNNHLKTYLQVNNVKDFELFLNEVEKAYGSQHVVEVTTTIAMVIVSIVVVVIVLIAMLTLVVLYFLNERKKRLRNQKRDNPVINVLFHSPTEESAETPSALV